MCPFWSLLVSLESNMYSFGHVEVVVHHWCRWIGDGLVKMLMTDQLEALVFDVYIDR